MKKYILPLVLFFQMALLFTEVPAWVIVTSLGFLFLSVIPWIKSLNRLKLITGLTSVAVVLVAVRQFNFVLSNELIASLLIILTSIRLIEHRLDVKEQPYFLFLLGLFLAVVKFVFQIDFIFGVYAFLATVFYLYQFFPESFQKNYRKESFRILRSIVGYAVPVTVLLFLLFPQFKFEGNRQHNYGLFSTIGASGFSAELRPGSISELVNNENIAFRAEFEDFLPAQDKLYWRGQVLDRVQGLMWRRSNPLNQSVELHEEDIEVYQPNYKIILEPHYKEQLFTLYGTSSVESQERMLRSEKNDTYSLPSVLSDRLVYNGFVQINRPELFSGGDKTEYLHLNRRAPKVEEMLKTLIPANSASVTADEKVKSIAKYFTDNRFEYRLSGQELAVNSLEDFLFKTKVGFCEHYASAAALLLRYMNVPSRVVVGYQGGELNSAGKFWTVKQQDAHAWVEYLNEKEQWKLFDPVNTIAPDRIAVGATLFSNPTGGQLLKRLSKQFQFFDKLSNFLEIFNYRWTLFFVEYSSSNLKNEILKFYDANEDVQLVAHLIFMLVCIYIIYALSIKYLFRECPLQDRYYSELHRFFAKKLPQEKNETFADWKLRIQEKYPETKDAIERIFEIYLRNRYGAEANQSEFRQFKSLLKDRNFKL